MPWKAPADAQLASADSTLQGCAAAFRHTHHHVRSKVHSLWLMGEVDDNLLLQRTLLKLTSMATSCIESFTNRAHNMHAHATFVGLHIKYESLQRCSLVKQIV